MSENTESELPIKHLKPSEFVDYLSNNELVLVDFWSETCMPCISQGELLEKEGQKILNVFPMLKFSKFNTAESIETDAKELQIKKGIKIELKIKYIPTIIIGYKNRIGIMESGVQSVDSIIKFIEKFQNHVDQKKNQNLSDGENEFEELNDNEEDEIDKTEIEEDDDELEEDTDEETDEDIDEDADDETDEDTDEETDDELEVDEMVSELMDEFETKINEENSDNKQDTPPK